MKKRKTVTVAFDDIKKVVDYLWDDEKRSYDECKPCKGHVFHSLKRLCNAVQDDYVNEATALSLLRDLYDLQENESIVRNGETLEIADAWDRVKRFFKGMGKRSKHSRCQKRR